MAIIFGRLNALMLGPVFRPDTDVFCLVSDPHNFPKMAFARPTSSKAPGTSARGNLLSEKPNNAAHSPNQGDLVLLLQSGPAQNLGPRVVHQALARPALSEVAIPEHLKKMLWLRNHYLVHLSRTRGPRACVAIAARPRWMNRGRACQAHQLLSLEVQPGRLFLPRT